MFGDIFRVVGHDHDHRYGRRRSSFGFPQAVPMGGYPAVPHPIYELRDGTDDKQHGKQYLIRRISGDKLFHALNQGGIGTACLFSRQRANIRHFRVNRQYKNRLRNQSGALGQNISESPILTCCTFGPSPDTKMLWG